MKIKDTIKISEEFTDTPGARYRSEGDWSGQEFLEDILLGRFEAAVKGSYILAVDLDDVWGFPSSFVSGSFGELSLKFGKEVALKHLKFISKSETKRRKFIDEIMDPQGK